MNTHQEQEQNWQELADFSKEPALKKATEIEAYEPYGDSWKQEMAKFKKSELIEMLAKSFQKNELLQKELQKASREGFMPENVIWL